MSIDVESEWFKVTDGLSKPVSDEWWSKITKNYNETGREAHNLSYLQLKLEELAAFRTKLSNLNAFILALFFQLYVYILIPDFIEKFDIFVTAFITILWIRIAVLRIWQALNSFLKKLISKTVH